MILVDWPMWPAHGLMWAHLVSDTSLDELHEFARGAGLPPRSFDLDHYDVAADRVADLVAAGAVQVTPRDLLRRLVDSGLRVPGHDRPEEKRRRRDHDLQRRWLALHEAAQAGEAGTGGLAGIDLGRWEAVGSGLLARWSEPHRSYHDLTHLHDVLGYLDVLREGGEHVTVPAVLAAWFHDAVYRGEPGADEEHSAVLAEEQLAGAGADADTVAETARLVRITAGHTPRDERDPACALIDADLAVLARPATQYAEYTEAVRREYAAVPEELFREGRAGVLERFCEREWIYLTSTGRERWESAARANLTREVALLRSPHRSR